MARHGALYAAEDGWDPCFEARVARIAADFVDRFDARREAGWIADWQGLPMMGCVCLPKARDDASAMPVTGVAQPCMPLVDPAARGRGMGKLLVDACHRFAADAVYTRVRLWTCSLRQAARAIYRQGGYRPLGSNADYSFGHATVGEVWDKKLGG